MREYYERHKVNGPPPKNAGTDKWFIVEVPSLGYQPLRVVHAGGNGVFWLQGEYDGRVLQGTVVGHAEIKDYETPCGVCGGFPPVSGRTCVCGGEGTAAAEGFNARKALIEAQVEAEDVLRSCGCTTDYSPALAARHLRLERDALQSRVQELEAALKMATRFQYGNEEEEYIERHTTGAARPFKVEYTDEWQSFEGPLRQIRPVNAANVEILRRAMAMVNFKESV